MKLLAKETVAQRVTPGRIRWFRKELIEVRGPEPLALVRKRRAEGDAHAPVILVHGFGQNRYAWHMPQRSMANYLAELGFDVFNVDLRGHGRSAELGSRRSRGVDDYIRGDLPAVIERGDASLSVRGTDGGSVETIVRPVPVVVKKLDVAFFPEGGDLVAGLPNRVYFQARTPLGKPADLHGRIVSAGQTVAEVALPEAPPAAPSAVKTRPGSERPTTPAM